MFQGPVFGDRNAVAAAHVRLIGGGMQHATRLGVDDDAVASDREDAGNQSAVNLDALSRRDALMAAGAHGGGQTAICQFDDLDHFRLPITDKWSMCEY